jgi:AcrR family transcriptional regulator
MSERLAVARPGEPRSGPARVLAPAHLPPETSRARMLAAAQALVCALGAEQLTATAVTAAARVSRTTFYATFADREDCLLALFDDLVERLGTAMLAAYASESSWLDGVRAAMCALLELLDSEPRLARFLILGGVSGDSALVARRRRVLADLARALEADSPAGPSAGEDLPFGSHALVSGAASIVHSRLMEDPVPALMDLSGSLMAVLVLPFVGEGVARRELAVRRDPASASSRSRRDGEYGSPVHAGRISERSARVLRVIAGAGGISNRQIAREAGNVDEGQMSKLLTRLAALGLIANDAPDSRGPNAWRVTRAGSDLLAGLDRKPGR